MIVVRVELLSARTGKVFELARLHIFNKGGGSAERADYGARTLRGRSRQQLDRNVLQRTGSVAGWPKRQLHVWNLVAAALRSMGYGRDGAA